MSALDTLIKLNRWQLDEQRRIVAALEAETAELRAQRQRLDIEQAVEQDVALENHEAAYGYSNYARVLIERRAALDRAIAESEERLLAARAVLADAFAEVKRYEIAAANRRLAAQRRLEQREQRQLDDVAIESFRRKDSAG